LTIPAKNHIIVHEMNALLTPAFLTGVLMEPEYEVLSHLQENEITSQRKISRRTGLSLGAVNLLMKKMVHI